ncbi:response regulator [Spirosoma flavus]
MKSAQNTINANFKSPKLLVVEDNDDQWLIIQQALRQYFNEVKALRAATIKEAITLLNEWEQQEWEIPKLILLDLYLPKNADGWHLLKQIKAMPEPISWTPIVMLTSSTNAADIEEAYQLGISAYMVKPTDFNDWLACFRELRTYWWETVTLPPVHYRI